MTNISCLVISKSYKLLNKLLTSLEQAKQEWLDADEVLCSWNGSVEESTLILGDTTPHFKIEQIVPYHFAKNINSLARMAKGKYVLIVNDDVILDAGCIDKAIKILEEQEQVGIVGGLLRNTDNTLSHAGVLFSNDLAPYNRCRPEFGNYLDIGNDEVRRSGPITAVTGALMLMARDDLLKIPMRENFTHCCEDIALCIDLLANTKKSTYYSSTVTAVHNEKSTRGETDDKQDFEALRKILKSSERDLPQLWKTNNKWQGQEIEWLKELCLRQMTRNFNNEVNYNKQLHIKNNEILRITEDRDNIIQGWNTDRSLLIEGQEALANRISQLEASMSWKITKPIRAVMNKIRKPVKE